MNTVLTITLQAQLSKQSEEVPETGPQSVRLLPCLRLYIAGAYLLYWLPLYVHSVRSSANNRDGRHGRLLITCFVRYPISDIQIYPISNFPRCLQRICWMTVWGRGEDPAVSLGIGWNTNAVVRDVFIFFFQRQPCSWSTACNQGNYHESPFLLSTSSHKVNENDIISSLSKRENKIE